MCLALVVGIANSKGAVITIINNDGAGEGFNDPTAAAPVGGNDGVTVGEQRLKVFERAAEIWGAKLSSNVEILIEAQFDSLDCDSTSGVLGSAGALVVIRDFTGAPRANTWYPSALANALADEDLQPASSDIGATFNSDLGTAGCLTTLNWYYGLDGNAPSSTIDLLDVILHEFGHGLGFQTFVSLSTGRKFSGSPKPGFDDIFMIFLEDLSTGKTYPDMNNNERVAASQDTGNLVWNGANVTANDGFLTSGLTSGFVRMYAPSPQEPGSSVSHFSNTLSPDELMEPFATPTSDRTLTTELFRDIGWTIISANTAPLALDDSLTVAEGATATQLDSGEGSVLDNDQDIENDALTATEIDMPAHGSLTLNSDGTFSYTHDGSATTSDSFTYEANDGTADSNVATVNIVVDTRAAWRNVNFSEADLNDPAKESTVWGDTANPDNDVLNNLMEYALDTDPNDGTDGEEAIGLTVEEDSGSPGTFYHVITFKRRTNDSGLSYIPEVSGDGTTWFNDAGNVAQEGAAQPAGPNFELVSFKDLTAVTPGNPRFFQLRVVK